MRPPAAVAHPPLHAGPAAARRSSPSPRPSSCGSSSCWQHVDPRHRGGRPGRRRRGHRAARRVRGAGGGVGGEHPARAGARLQARVAGPADAGRRGGVGAAVGRGAVAGPPHAHRARARGPSSTPGRRWRRRRARPDPGPTAREVLDVLQAARRAVFVQEIARVTHLPLASVEEGLGALVAAGRVTCDSFGGLRWLLVPAWRRRSAGLSSGRWSLVTADAPATPRPRLRRHLTRSSSRARCCAAPASSSAAR